MTPLPTLKPPGPQPVTPPGTLLPPGCQPPTHPCYGARLPDALLPRVDALPRAQALLRLAPALLAAGGAVAPAQALPTYVRDKVAQTTRERAAARLADIRP